MIPINFARINVMVNYFCMPVVIFLLILFDLFLYFWFNEKVALLYIVTMHAFVAAFIIVIEGSIAGKLIYERCTRHKKWIKYLDDAANSCSKNQVKALDKIYDLLSLNDQTTTKYLIKNGLIRDIVLCLDSTDNAVKSKALKGLQLIAMGSPQQARVIAKKATPVIVRMLESNSFKIAKHALSLLFILTKKSLKLRNRCTEYEILPKLQKFVGKEAWLELAHITAELLPWFYDGNDFSYSCKTRADLTSLLSKLDEYPDNKIFDENLTELAQRLEEYKAAKIAQQLNILEPLFSPSNKELATSYRQSNDSINSCTVEKPVIQIEAENDTNNRLPQISYLHSNLIHSSSTVNTEASDGPKAKLNYSSKSSSLHSDITQDDSSIHELENKANGNIFVIGSCYFDFDADDENHVTAAESDSDMSSDDFQSAADDNGDGNDIDDDYDDYEDGDDDSDNNDDDDDEEEVVTSSNSDNENISDHDDDEADSSILRLL